MTAKTSQEIDIDLIRKTADLARSAPREWELFLVAMQAHADHKKDECVRAPLELLQVAQGTARAAAAYHDLFRNAVTTAARIAERRTNNTT